MHHFTLCLEFKSNVAYKVNQKECANWIKEDTYKDSIYNVISNAIADCVLGRNEFAKDKVKDGVVTFDNKNYESYTAENWNAVVLYNLIHYIYKNRDFEGKCNIAMFYKEYIESKKIQSVYGKQFEGKIERAFGDIKEYNRNLNIIAFLIDKNYLDGLYKHSRICEDYDIYGYARIEINGSTHLLPDFGSLAYKCDGAIERKANVNLYIKGKKVDQIIAYEDMAMYNCDLDDYMNITQKSKIAGYKYPRDSSEATTTILRYNINLRNRKGYRTKKTIKLTPEVEKICDAIDVCWHLCYNGEYKLDWVAANKSYLAKAYVDPREELEIEFGAAKTEKEAGQPGCRSIGCKCFTFLDVVNGWTERKDRITGIQDIGYKSEMGDNYVWIENRVLVNINNTAGLKLYMPECCDDLINNAPSIRSIDLSCAEFGRTKTCLYMISHNPNLERIDLSGENKLKIMGNNHQDFRYMIFGNDKIKKINLELDYASDANYGRMIDSNKFLESVEINCNDHWRKLPPIKYMIGMGNDKLKKVSVVVYSNKDEIEKEYNAQKVMMPDGKEDTLISISTHGEGEQSNTEIISRRNKKPE